MNSIKVYSTGLYHKRTKRFSYYLHIDGENYAIIFSCLLSRGRSFNKRLSVRFFKNKSLIGILTYKTLSMQDEEHYHPLRVTKNDGKDLKEIIKNIDIISSPYLKSTRKEELINNFLNAL